MVYLTKKDTDRITKALSKNSDKEIKQIIQRMNSHEKRIFVRDKSGIKKLLREAFAEKRKVKIRYYSLSSDEVRWRTVSIYQLGADFIIAFCHLRNEERTFVIDRINSAAILNEHYEIPMGWEPESIVY